MSLFSTLPKPLRERALVKLVPVSEKTKGGIILPVSAQDPQWARGSVLAVGSGQLTVNGVSIPLDVTVGDLIQFNKRAATPCQHAGEILWLVEERDIQAKFVPEKQESP